MDMLSIFIYVNTHTSLLFLGCDSLLQQGEKLFWEKQD